MKPLVLLVVLAAAMQASDLRITDVDPLLRPGLLFRCTVVYSGPDGGPCVLSAAILQGDRELSRVDIPLARAAEAGNTGARLALPIAEPPRHDGPPPRLAVTLSGPGMQHAAERTINTLTAAQNLLEDHYQWIRTTGETDPLPWLWIEQGAALASGPPTLGRMRGLDGANRALAAWREGKKPALGPGTQVLALRDPVDGSIQPYRLHLPERPAHAPVALLLLPVRDARKEEWPVGAPALISAMTAAGLAVVEAYPAGDSEWTGVAPRRARLALNAAVAATDLDATKPVLVAQGVASAGAVRLADATPDAWGGLLLIDGRWAATDVRPDNLATMPVAVIGAATGAAGTWMEQLRTAGGVPTQPAPTATDPLVWRWLLAARHQPLPTSTPRSCVRSAPGPAGPVLIEELATWGQPGIVRWQGDPPQISTQGIARLQPETTLPPGTLIDGAAWTRPRRTADHAPRKRWGQACGPLASYADAPFVVIQGTGESEAAAQANAILADRFVAAWVAHAHGAPPRIIDRSFTPADWAGRHLIFIGNARSNRVLRDLVEDGLRLPISWDARQVLGPGIACLRAERRPFALCWPHPAADGRLLVVLDGAPAWSETGLPLAGLGDLFIGPASPNGRPLVDRRFGNEWD